jgi:hypothetical protein
MTIQEVKQQLDELGRKHALADNDEPYSYESIEMDAYELLARYIIAHNIALKGYDMKQIYEWENDTEAVEINYWDVYPQIYSKIIEENNPLDAPPELVELYQYLENAIWGQYKDDD